MQNMGMVLSQNGRGMIALPYTTENNYQKLHEPSLH